MQTVAETAHYRRRAMKVLTEAEREAVIERLAADPTCGIPLAGGIRKVRVAARSQGKSGGARVIYCYFSSGAPVYLLEAFGKGERANLTKIEQAELVKVAKLIAAAYGA
jgi:hypothetical protein